MNSDSKNLDNVTVESHGETEVGDVLTLRFRGTDEDGHNLHELRVGHVAEVLEGLSEFVEGLESSGVLHSKRSLDAELFVRPAREGSFIIEVIRAVTEDPEALGEVYETVKTAEAKLADWGVPTLGAIIWWATKGMRAAPQDVEYLENEQVKVKWQDNTVDVIPLAAWEELLKSPKRRKKQLRKIMAPLEDPRVRGLEINDVPPEESDDERVQFVLDHDDYAASKPETESESSTTHHKFQGRILALDFNDSGQWKVETPFGVRKVTIADRVFLDKIGDGLSITKEDKYQMVIIEEKTVKNERTNRDLTVVHIEKVEDGEGNEED